MATKKNLKKSNIIEEDEISLIDIIRVLWRWRYFIISFIGIVTLISIIYVTFKPVYYKSQSIIKLASFNDTLIENQNEVNDYLHSLICAEEAKKFFGEKTFYKMLNLDIDAMKKYLKSDELWSKLEFNRIILERMRSMISFEKNYYLIVKSRNPIYSINLNKFLAEQIVKRQNNLLNKKLENYKERYKAIFFRTILSKEKFVIPSLTFQNACIILSADKNVIEKISKKRTIVIISFCISIFIAIFLAFILEFFRNLDWKQVINL